MPLASLLISISAFLLSLTLAYLTLFRRGGPLRAPQYSALRSTIPGMNLRFCRRIRIAPGVDLNLGLHGAGLSVRPRGLHVGLNRQGMYTSADIRGTGIYAVHHVRKSPGEQPTVEGDAAGCVVAVDRFQKRRRPQCHGEAFPLAPSTLPLRTLRPPLLPIPMAGSRRGDGVSGVGRVRPEAPLNGSSAPEKENANSQRSSHCAERSRFRNARA